MSDKPRANVKVRSTTAGSSKAMWKPRVLRKSWFASDERSAASARLPACIAERLNPPFPNNKVRLRTAVRNARWPYASTPRARATNALATKRNRKINEHMDNGPVPAMDRATLEL